MTGPKVMTLRLDGELAATLAIVAQVHKQTVTEAIRIALTSYLPTRLSTPPGDPSPTPNT